MQQDTTKEYQTKLQKQSDCKVIDNISKEAFDIASKAREQNKQINNQSVICYT